MKNIYNIGDNTQITYITNFLLPELYQGLFDFLKDSLVWRQDSFNKWPVPRLTFFEANQDIVYKYSGLTHNGIGISEKISSIIQLVNTECQQDFNSVLYNYYRHENDSIGLHADNEPELGANPVVAALSLGGTRLFKLVNNKSRTSIHLPLEDNSLIIMGSNCQLYWKHGIDKKTGNDPRISLTFRKIIYK